MSKVIRYTRGDLGNIGHQSLREILVLKPVHQLTIQQAVGVGILATLLRIADTQEKLLANQNMDRQIKEMVW